MSAPSRRARHGREASSPVGGSRCPLALVWPCTASTRPAPPTYTTRSVSELVVPGACMVRQSPRQRAAVERSSTLPLTIRPGVPDPRSQLRLGPRAPDRVEEQRHAVLDRTARARRARGARIGRGDGAEGDRVEHGRGWFEALLAVGGALPRLMVLADPEGNELCLSMQATAEVPQRCRPRPRRSVVDGCDATSLTACSGPGRVSAGFRARFSAR